MTRFPEQSAQAASPSTLEKGFAILSSLDDERSAGRSLRSISRKVGLPVSTVHRLMAVMIELGYVVREESGYVIGPEVRRLARSTGSARSEMARAKSLLESVRTTTGETVGLHVRSKDQRVCLLEVESHNLVRVVSGAGRRYGLGTAAAGQVLLAGLSFGDIPLLLHRGVVSEAQVVCLGDVSANGYAMSFGENIPGAHAVAVPWALESGVGVAALNVTGPSDRMPQDRLLEIAILCQDLLSAESPLAL